MKKTREYIACDYCRDGHSVPVIGKCIACGKDICKTHGEKRMGPTAGGNGPLLLTTEIMLCNQCPVPQKIAEIMATAYDNILFELNQQYVAKQKCSS